MRFEIMGVINVTPDSFSDGGKFLDSKNALRKLEELFENGADWVDIGAESTRPGATAVSEEEEWKRLAPVLTQIKSASILRKISIDTRSADVMRRSIDHGIGLINCVGNVVREESVLKKAAQQGIKYCATHMHGEPHSMQQHPLDGKTAIAEVQKFFSTTYSHLSHLGFNPEQIYLDPGIGFGKSEAANWLLLAETTNFAKTFQTLIGVSRKSFLGKLFEIENPEDRDDVSHAIEIGVAMAGAKMIRTHDVAKLNQMRSLLN